MIIISDIPVYSIAIFRLGARIILCLFHGISFALLYRLSPHEVQSPESLWYLCYLGRLFELHAGWSFGVQAGNESCIDSPNPKAGSDFKRFFSLFFNGIDLSVGH